MRDHKLCALAVMIALVGCSAKKRLFIDALPGGNPDGGVPTVGMTDSSSGQDASAGRAQSVTGQTNASCDGDSGVCVSSAETDSVCVATGPRDCTSGLDNDCDGQPDDSVDDICRCVPENAEPCDAHPGLDGRGQCRAGLRTCILGAGNGTTYWGSCEGAVGPGDVDSCTVAGDDSDCDGIPNGGCPCVPGETAACGPNSDDGICRRGISTCENGVFGPCVGAIFSGARNCASAEDNDCDARPDNTVDNVCACVIGDTAICGEHPGLDGIGQCRAGQRRCELGANNATSRFGACTGSVGPAAQDSCIVSGADANCDGTPNGGCECVAGMGNGPCAGDSRNSRCNGQGQCVPCVVNGDCALISGGQSFCTAGQCISRVADGSPCQVNGDCLNGVCRDQFLNSDGDSFPDMRAGIRVCGNTPLPARAFARADGQTDCCDADVRAFPGAPTPPPIGNANIAGFAESNGCLNFDYDCRSGETSFGRQARLYQGDCPGTSIEGLSSDEAFDLCLGLSGWNGVSPPCGASGTMFACGAAGSTCVSFGTIPEPRLCF